MTPTEGKARGVAPKGNGRQKLISRIDAVEGVNTTIKPDTCPEVAAGIKKFLQRDGVTKAMLLGALGNINHNSMGQFLSSKEYSGLHDKKGYRSPGT